MNSYASPIGIQYWVKKFGQSADYWYSRSCRSGVCLVRMDRLDYWLSFYSDARICEICDRPRRGSLYAHSKLACMSCFNKARPFERLETECDQVRTLIKNLKAEFTHERKKRHGKSNQDDGSVAGVPG